MNIPEGKTKVKLNCEWNSMPTDTKGYIDGYLVDALRRSCCVFVSGEGFCLIPLSHVDVDQED